MGSALPDWVTPVAWTYIAVSVVSAALVAADIYLLRHRHDSPATELVWVASALYLGPLAVPVYLGRGRAGAAVATLPGGGASAVAHLVAVPLVAAVGWTIAGMAMWPMIIVIAVLAVVLLAAYEHAESRAGHTSARRGLSVGAALFAAVVTVVAFDVGMVGWMLLLHVNDMMPAVTEGSFWFLMQLGVVVGLVTGYPAVRWLLDRDRASAPAMS